MAERQHDRMMRQLREAYAELLMRPYYDPKFRPRGEAAQDAFDRDLDMMDEDLDEGGDDGE